jgi:predicted nucleotidyltransferase
MASLIDIIKILRENKAMLKQNYSVTKLGLFGSYVRGDNSENSDIDILADFEKSPGLEFVDLADELEKLLNVKVDLVSRYAIHDRFMKYIEKEIMYV